VSVGAILLCGGKGERLGRDEPKALVPLAGRPLFTWSLETLEQHAVIEAIVVVGPVARLKEALAATDLRPAKIVGWTEGGRERQDSVGRGLQALPGHFSMVAIHDSARPLVNAALISRVVADALESGAAIAALPLEDTLKRGTLRSVDQTVARAGLWRAQTPQVFRRDWLDAAHRQAMVHASDDAAVVESLGHPVRLVTGDAVNFKITTPPDLELAEAWLARREART